MLSLSSSLSPQLHTLKVGWFKSTIPGVPAARSTYRLGWKGYKLCDGDYENCGADTDSDDSGCATKALKAAGAFSIISIILGFPVLVSSFLTTFQAGPPLYHFNRGTMALSFATSLFSLLAWTVAIGRVYDCDSTPTPKVDHNPPFLIVAQVIYLVVGIAHIVGK